MTTAEAEEAVGGSIPPQEEEGSSEVATVAAPEEEVTKPRLVKKPVKPDDEEYKAQMDALQGEIDKNKRRIDEISQQISGRSRSNESAESRALRTKMNTLRGEFNGLLDQKRQAKQELEVVSKTRDSVRTTLRAMKSKMPYPTVQKIDEQIARLEDMLQHESLNLSDEKQTLVQIKNLKASRATVAEYNEKLDRLNADEAVRGAIVDRLKAADEKLNGLKEQMDATRAATDELRAKESAASADIPALHEDRAACKAVIEAAYAKKSELYASFKARMDEWRDLERAWRAQRDEDRKRKQEQSKREWEERQAARKARDAEMAGEPFDKEVTQCEQLGIYLAKYVAKEEAAAAPEDKPAASLGDGFKLVERKKEREQELDSIFLGLSKGKGKSKKGKASRAKQLEEVDPADLQLSHTVDILATFSGLKLPVPMTAGDVPAAIDALEQKKAYYLERRRRKKEGEEDPEAVEEVAASPAAAPAPVASSSGAVADEFPALPGNGPLGGKAAALPGSAAAVVANGVPNGAAAGSWGGGDSGGVKVKLELGDDGGVALQLVCA